MSHGIVNRCAGTLLYEIWHSMPMYCQFCQHRDRERQKADGWGHILESYDNSILKIGISLRSQSTQPSKSTHSQCQSRDLWSDCLFHMQIRFGSHRLFFLSRLAVESRLRHLSNTGLSLINKGVSLIILTIGSEIQDRIGFSEYPDPFLFSKTSNSLVFSRPPCSFNGCLFVSTAFLSLSSQADLLQITIIAITGEMHAKRLGAI